MLFNTAFRSLGLPIFLESMRAVFVKRRRRPMRVQSADVLEQRLLLAAAPIADAGSTRSMAVAETITLSAAKSYDPDGSIASYAWDLDGDGQFDDATGVKAEYFGARAGQFRVSVRVTDDHGLTATDTADIVAYATNTGQSFQGYTLFIAQDTNTVHLMDNSGTIVHTWNVQYTPGAAISLLENGQLLYAGSVNSADFNIGGRGGNVQMIAWDGTVTWEYQYASTAHLQHHDVTMLPNGNVMMVTWQEKTGADAIAAGRNPALLVNGELWPDSIIEVEPVGSSGGNIVWEWNSWDHLIQDFDNTKDHFGVVADHPELIDINYNIAPIADWQHMNSVAYNAELDQIVMSSRSFSEFWVVDHSTTTQEAAGHTGGRSGRGGDLLYRWGNPAAYKTGTAADQTLFVQHNAHWIGDGLPGEGHLMIFNNGIGRPGGDYSSVEEMIAPVNPDGTYALTSGEAYGPDSTVWTYTENNPADFVAAFMSSAQRLPNGNTLIINGPSSYFFEVTPAGQKVWDYQATGRTFRVLRYAPEYSGFDGTPLDDVAHLTGPVASGVQQRPEITWTPVRNATSYNIWIKNLSTNVNPFHQGTSANPSYTPSVDLGVGRFRVWIQPVFGTVKGQWSDQATFTINTPVQLDPIPDSLTTPRPAISWQAIPGAVTYDLWVDSVTTGTQQFVRMPNLATTSWTAPSDWPIGDYKIWVRAKDASGLGARWSTAEVTSLVTQPVPTAPLSSTFDRTPTFTWNAVAGALDYELVVRNRNTGAVVIHQANISGTSWTPSTPLPDSPYRWWVFGESATGFRTRSSAAVDFYVGGRPDLLAPSGNVSNTRPTFTWKAVQDSVRYELSVERVGVQYQYLSVTNITTISYLPQNAMPAGAYRFWVRAISNSSEASSWSLPMTFTIT
ncbi:MAG: aryl-sulfate sulfotransferase [Planctomyces sp.]|nr:aryl-sulfate sulfotransferase [Planctomyces sp.]